MKREVETLRVKILNMVCEAFECTVDDVRGRTRKKIFSDARCVYTYLARHHLGDTFIRIGIDLSKDHSSVIEQLDRMQNMIFTKEPAAHKLKRIEQELLQKQLI